MILEAFSDKITTPVIIYGNVGARNAETGEVTESLTQKFSGYCFFYAKNYDSSFQAERTYLQSTHEMILRPQDVSGITFLSSDVAKINNLEYDIVTDENVAEQGEVVLIKMNRKK